jgi:hypothetical protein
MLPIYGQHQARVWTFIRPARDERKTAENTAEMSGESDLSVNRPSPLPEVCLESRNHVCGAVQVLRLVAPAPLRFHRAIRVVVPMAAQEGIHGVR